MLVFLEKLRCMNTFNANLKKNFVRADGNISGYQTYPFYAGGVIYTAYTYKTHTKGTNSWVIQRQTGLPTSHNLFTLQSLQECDFPSTILFFLQLPTSVPLPPRKVSISFLKIRLSLLPCFFYSWLPALPTLSILKSYK